MVRRLVSIVAGVALALSLVSATALAGQPNASCEDSTSSPNGFSSGGFQNHADANYAGNGPHSQNANSGNAVSQYDVACYQLSQPHP